MKPSYRRAVEFIAEFDDARNLTEEEIAILMTTNAVSEALGVEPEKIARSVFLYLKKEAQK